MSPSSSDIPRKTAQEVKECLDRGEQVYVIDARNKPDDNQIKGAVYYKPAAILETGDIAIPVSRDTLIIIY